ncbi:MAG: flagellin [Nitrospinota bacterium]
MAISISSSGLFGIQNKIGQTSDKLGGSLSKLASGLRINKAADDAAGLAIAEKLSAQVSSLDQAARNVGAGSALLRTAEGGLGQIGDLVGRARELAVQAGTGTVNDEQRATLNREFQATLQEIDRIAGTTEFNGQNLLTGDLGPTAANPVAIQAGAGNTQNDRIDINVVNEATTTALGIQNEDISTAQNALSALAPLDNAQQQVTSNRASVGALSNRLESTAANLSVARENLMAAEEQIRGLDFADETSRQKGLAILQQVGVKALQQGLRGQENLVGGLLNIRG